MLEKAPEAEYGGNARYSGTGFRFVHGGAQEIRAVHPRGGRRAVRHHDHPALRRRRLHGRSRPHDAGAHEPRSWRRSLVAQSNAALHWMRQIGIRWEPLKEHAKVGDKRYFERGIAIHVAGGGIGQLTQWRQIADALGIEIRFDSPVCAVHRRPAAGRGRRGQRAGRPLRPHGQGGDRLRGRLPGQSGNARALSRRQHRPDEGARQPPRYRRGAALSARHRRPRRRPLAIGPHVADRRQRARLRDPAARRRPRQYPEPLRLSLRHQRQCARRALLRRGRGAAFLHLCQDRPRRAGAAGRAAPIRSTIRRASSACAIRTIRRPTSRRRTIAELAGKIGIEAAVLSHTVAEFNDAVRDDIPFDPTRPDGKATQRAGAAEIQLGLPHRRRRRFAPIR